MTALIIPLMMFLGRGAGSNLLGLKTVWGLLFALPIALASMAMFALPWWGFIIAFVVAWRGFEFGHGTFFAMRGYYDGDSKEGDKPRIQTLEKMFRPLYVAVGGNITHPMYSWVMMGVKGFIIGLPLLWWAIPLAVLYPTAYWYGFKVEKNKSIAELISAMAVGAIVCLAILS